MNCSRTQNELYLNFGIAPEEQGGELSAHLKSCPECTKLNNELTRLSRRCTCLKEYTPGNHIWDAIEKEMEHSNLRLIRNELENAETASVFSLWRTAAAAAVVFLVAISIVFLGMNRTSKDTGDSGPTRISDTEKSNAVIYRPQYQPAAVREETVFAIPIEGNIIMFRSEEESDSGYRNCTFNF